MSVFREAELDLIVSDCFQVAFSSERRGGDSITNSRIIRGTSAREMQHLVEETEFGLIRMLLMQALNVYLDSLAYYNC